MRRHLSNPWTLASLLVATVVLLWTVRNLTARSQAYDKTMADFSGQAEGTVTEQQVSTTLTVVRERRGGSTTESSGGISHSVRVTAKYQVEGKDYQVTGKVHDRAPKEGDVVTVYYNPAHPGNGYLKDGLRERAIAHSDRHTHPVGIMVIGAGLAAGLWFIGQRKGRRPGSEQLQTTISNR